MAEYVYINIMNIYIIYIYIFRMCIKHRKRNKGGTVMEVC